MLKKRKHYRYTRRLETEFRVGERVLRGISSNISERGIFIRTSTPLTVGSYVEATLLLHDGRRAKVSGIVRRATRTSFTMIKNGMGIELTVCDSNFLDILRELGSEDSSIPCDLVGDSTGESKGNESCPASLRPSVFTAPTNDEGSSAPRPEFIIVSCMECGTKNKVRTGMPDRMTPKCGKCKALLLIP